MPQDDRSSGTIALDDQDVAARLIRVLDAQIDTQPGRAHLPITQVPDGEATGDRVLSGATGGTCWPNVLARM